MGKFVMSRSGTVLCASALLLGGGLSCLLGATDDWITNIETLIQNKEIATAENMIVGKLVTDPRNPALITLLAEVRFDQRKYKEALQLINDADAISGPTAKGTTLRGLVAVAQSRLDPGELQFREAIRLDPSYAFAHYYLGRLLYTRNHFNESIEETKAAVAAAPNLVRAYENLGLCYEAKQQINEAKRWYLVAIEMEASGGKKTEWPSLDLATMLIRNDRVDEAKPYLVDALNLNPDNPKSHFQMAIVLESTGDFDGALRQLEQTTKLDRTMAGAHYRAARIYKKLGKKDLADKEFAQFQGLSEAQHSPALNQGRSLP
jgi:tetratricopeptide (TPR) repeat protein